MASAASLTASAFVVKLGRGSPSPPSSWRAVAFPAEASSPPYSSVSADPASRAGKTVFVALNSDWSLQFRSSGGRSFQRSFDTSSHGLCSSHSFSGTGGFCSIVQGKKLPSLAGGGSSFTSRTSAVATSLPLLLPADAHVWATLSALLSKVLGYLVICGSVFLKVPQILRVLKNRSVEGLNKFSFEAECLGYTMALAYCVNKGVPFHVYGELFFILAQAIVLMSCIYKFSPPCNWTKLKVPLYICLAGVLFCGHLPSSILETIYNMQTTMFTMARLPQIWTNYREGSTGELSATSYLMSVTGCTARLYTSIFSNAPSSMVVSSIAGLCTHGTLLMQIVVYGSQRNLKVE